MLNRIWIGKFGNEENESKSAMKRGNSVIFKDSFLTRESGWMKYAVIKVLFSGERYWIN